MEYKVASDEELVAAAQAVDDLAFKELMSRYVGPILGFAKQYVRSEEDAEDVAQDAFFKAWRYLGRFRPGAKFRPWLYTIARNTALDHIEKRHSIAFSSLDDDAGDVSFADTLEDEDTLRPDAVFEKGELKAEVEVALQALHPEHREVILMRYRDELSFDEIAEVMSAPMNTVKSWHRRALGKLRDLLPHHGA